MRSRQRLRRHVGLLPYLALSITVQETRFQMHSEFLTDAESEKKGGGGREVVSAGEANSIPLRFRVHAFEKM